MRILTEGESKYSKSETKGGKRYEKKTSIISSLGIEWDKAA